jgi:hypothetical protein
MKKAFFALLLISLLVLFFFRAKEESNRTIIQENFQITANEKDPKFSFSKNDTLHNTASTHEISKHSAENDHKKKVL